MARYELTLSPDYVKHWTLMHAVRELLQNGLDQQIENPDNVFSYKFGENELTISNKESILSKSTLLLGNTTKADNEETIGQFGEGYKLALLVLTRLGYKTCINNYHEKETWTPKIINSRRYKSKLLVIDISSSLFKKKHSNLEVIVEGLTAEDIENLKKSTLVMQDYNSHKAGSGQILTDERHKGEIFINGLYICNNTEAGYGYNFGPDMIKVDRDRQLVSDFELFWNTSFLWKQVKDVDVVTDVVLSGIKDISFIQNISYELTQAIGTKFFNKYGTSLKPVHSGVTTGGSTIIVPEFLYNILKNSDINKDVFEEKPPPELLLQTFYDKHIYEQGFGDEFLEDFEVLIEKSRGWF